MDAKTAAEQKRQMMLTEPVELLVCKQSVPTIISMLISAFYNMADTYFVGQLNTTATAAVGLALPLMNVIQAIGFFYGHGSGNYISRCLGSGNTESAKKTADTAVALSLISGFALMILGLIFVNPLVVLLGALPQLVGPSAEYVSIVLIGMPFVMTSFTMNNQLRFQGSAYKGMIGMACGSLLNVALDPLFIYGFDMGVRGAAVATVIGQITSFVVLLGMSGRLHLRKPEISFTRSILGAIVRFGVPSLLRQSIMSVATICLNHAAGDYGEAVIAAISVVSKIVMVGAFVVIGIGQGFQPVCGFNNGAGRYDRVKRMYLFCIAATSSFMLVFGAVVFIFAPQLILVFRNDPAVLEAGLPLLRFQCITGVLQGIIIMTNMLLQNMGKTVSASILAMARQGLIFIPLVYILPHFFGITGLQITQSAADFLTALITLPMSIISLNELGKKTPEKL